MPKVPRITCIEAEKRLNKSGFEMIRSKGGHRIYYNGKDRFILPFHKGKNLHPKIVKDLIELLEKNQSIP